MTAIRGTASQRGNSRVLQLALKAVVVIAFGVALVALARGPVTVGGSALAPAAATGQPAGKGAPQEAQSGAPEQVRYFPREFPDVEGDPAPVYDTF